MARLGLLLFVALLFVPSMAVGQISWSSTLNVDHFSPEAAIHAYGCSDPARDGGTGGGNFSRCSSAMSNTAIPTVGTIWSFAYFDTDGTVGNPEFAVRIETSGANMDALNGHVLNIGGATVTVSDAATTSSTGLYYFNPSWLTWPWSTGTMCVQVYAADATPPGCGVSASLPAPSDLRLGGATEDSLTVQWRGVTGADEYRVRLNRGRWNAVTDTSYTFTDLKPATEYEVSVYGFGNGLYGDTAYATFSTLAVGAPAVPLAGAVLLGLWLALGARHRLR